MIPKNIFLDRDGTIIEDKHYLADPNSVVLLSGVGHALSRVAEAGSRLFLVSNQSGIGRGFFTEEAVLACQNVLNEQLFEYGVSFFDTQWCPHSPDDACSCRKPKIGMWEYFLDMYKLQASESIMIGDKDADIVFGVNAGFPMVFLVGTGEGLAQGASLGYAFPHNDELVCRVKNVGRTTVMTSNSLGSIVEWLLRTV